MADTSLEESYLTLIEFLMLSKRRVIELGAEEGLTGMQTMTLFCLSKPRAMSGFSKLFNCDASNVTGIIDGLEQKKLVSRYESPTDRRIKMVQLEPAGLATRASLLSRLTSEDSPILSRLSPSEFQTFIGLLQKINAG
ncbi:MAG TPA: MarR family transcriptional regulator [Candidatus Saccharimonadales bacterium]